MHSRSLFRSPRRTRGTSLLEVLVVMVIFLVGMLAIVQVFPKGFQILITTRNNSISSALARDLVERLKSDPLNMPELIVAVYRGSDGRYIGDPGYNPNTLDAMGDSLLPDGILRSDGIAQGPWQLHSGPNVLRRIIGEGGRVPAPRLVGANSAYYGGLMVCQFGPIDYEAADPDFPSNLRVYGNDLYMHSRPEDNLERWTDGEFYVSSPYNSGIAVRLPTGPSGRVYRVTFSAYVQNGTGYVKRDYIDLGRVTVSASSPDPLTGQYPLEAVSLGALISPDSLASVDLGTLRVQREFVEIANASAFGNDPYQYKLLDNALGVLLFNPIAASVYFSTPNGRQPLNARINYDVYDWRVLKEDFRLAPTGGTQQYRLALGNLKVAGEVGADGQRIGRISILEDVPPAGFSDDSEADEARANNFVVVDLDTGGLVMERLPNEQKPPDAATNPLIIVNKNSGVVTFRDADGDPSNGTTAKLLLPDKTIRDVQLENRALRVMYRAKNEFAVQVLKAASSYSVSPASPPGIAQFYVGGSNGTGASTRIYFPVMDVGRKVTVGEINYFAGSQARQILGQDFVIRFQPGDPLPGLPSIDIRDVDSAATGFNYSSGAAAKEVRGASVAVRVLWNPDTFFLTSDTQENMRRLEKWGQSWRKSVNETYLERTEAVR